MFRKFISAIFIFGFLFSPIFAQSEEDAVSETEEEVLPKFEPESESENSFFSFSLLDAALSAGDVFLINMIFNYSARAFLEEDYAQTNLSTMKENFQSRWVWDNDGFFMNQAGHPYQGSLYFAAARSNGLGFWQSALVAGLGSFFWEEIGETTTPSVNDFITTPICGTILGETLHRLFIDANELCPWLAWIISPLDALNSLYRGKALSVSGHIEEMDLVLHGGFESSKATFSGDYEPDSFKKIPGGFLIHTQYGNPESHDTKEPFDLFTSDLDCVFSANFYNFDFAFDGFLWSRGLYFEESGGTLGLNLMYEGKKSSYIAFSNAAFGVKYIGTKLFSEADRESRLKFSAQIDGIFMGTRALYYLYEDYKIDLVTSNPVRSYNYSYGALAKAGFSIGNSLLGSFSLEGGLNFTIPYPGSTLEGAEGTKHFMATAKASYEHKITKHFSLGVKDYLIYKADWFKNKPDTKQILNSVQIFGKFAFKRDN